MDWPFLILGFVIGWIACCLFMYVPKHIRDIITRG
jgi:hypothetical protein